MKKKDDRDILCEITTILQPADSEYYTCIASCQSMFIYLYICLLAALFLNIYS